MVTFEEARGSNSPVIRQAYIDSLYLGDHAKYVQNIRYVPMDNDRCPNVYASAGISSLGGMISASLGFKGTKSKIEFHPIAFGENVECEGDFLSILDHELRHAWQNSERPKSSGASLGRLVRAFALVIRNAMFPSLEPRYTYDESSVFKESDALRYQLYMIHSGAREVSLNTFNSIKESCYGRSRAGLGKC